MATDPPPPEHILERLPNGLDAISQGWLLEASSGDTGSFGLVAYFDTQSETLAGLGFGWLGINRFQPNMTIERIIRELGEPDYMFVNFSIGGPGDSPHANIDTTILYESGFAFDRFDLTPVTEIERSEDGTVLAIATELCFGDNYPRSNGNVTITAPLTNGLEGLSPIQSFLIGDVSPRTSIPIEEVSNQSLEQISRLALQQDNACIRLELERLQ